MGAHPARGGLPTVSERPSSEAFDFRGKRALVTGGSRGIGAVIGKTLAHCGAEVFLNYREDAESAGRTVQEIEAAGGKAHGIRANLVHPDEIRKMLEGILASGDLHFLIHNAALGSFKPVMDLRANQWDLTLAVNARALLLCAQGAVAGMPAGGRIVGLSSLGSHRVVPSYGAIGASKAALEAVIRSLAVELGPKGIAVNGVSGGVVDGPTIRQHPAAPTLLARAVRRTPLGRLGTAEDLARVVLFLCSPLSSWINGQVLVADGGMSLTL